MGRIETIGDATLYLGDCLEILPTLGKVDAVVKDSLTNNTAYDTNSYGTTRREREARERIGESMGFEEGRDSMALRESGMGASRDSKVLRSFTSRDSKGIQEAGYSAARERELREAERALQRRIAEHAIPTDDRERQVLEMWRNGSACNPSSEREPSRQSPRESASALRSLSQSADEKAFLEWKKGIAIVTDPPYGIEGSWFGGNTARWGKFRKDGASEARQWDIRPTASMDLIKAIDCSKIIWGGQYFALPASGAWLVWDKIVRNFSTGVCELAWTNLGNPIRAFNYAHGELATEGKEHPTQKPLPLMQWCLGFLPDAETILDPFMGSGTTGVACANLGRKFIGIEICEQYFNVACERIKRAYAQPRLFEDEKPAAPKPQELPL